MPMMVLDTQEALLDQTLDLEKDWALCVEGRFLSPSPGTEQGTNSSTHAHWVSPDVTLLSCDFVYPPTLDSGLAL